MIPMMNVIAWSFTDVMVAIAAISLLVGGIGILNVVLATAWSASEKSAGYGGAAFLACFLTPLPGSAPARQPPAKPTI
jgi:uncharacterized YccA/Bax inhibitor family protein